MVKSIVAKGEIADTVGKAIETVGCRDHDSRIGAVCSQVLSIVVPLARLAGMVAIGGGGVGDRAGLLHMSAVGVDLILLGASLMRTSHC